MLLNEIEKLKHDIELKDKIILKKDNEVRENREKTNDENKENNNKDTFSTTVLTQSSKPNFDIFRLSSNLIKTFTGHKSWVCSIDYSTFDGNRLLCSGSADKTVRVWDIDTNKQTQVFNVHSAGVNCVKFSPYHYYNNRHGVICSSSHDKTICFWDIKNDQQLQIFNGHTDAASGIEFSPFNGGKYLCSGSFDKTICLWDVETSKSLHVFNGHTNRVLCVSFSPLQSNNNESNSIGVIGGNGYTICSGSFDKMISIWDIETIKQFILFKGHEDNVWSVKYGSNELGNSGGANTILSGSHDKSVRLWDIRSSQQIQVFNGHTSTVYSVEYTPFLVKNIEVGDSSNVICSGSFDNTVRFWDIRSNKKELYVINGDKEDGGILCFKFLSLKMKNKNNDYNFGLCYGSINSIRIWG
ncbi:WD-40 repeat protein [Reticulomyxa filosa]|uniref:WD-40 repeat protein n=1 Tax=Reticulomyxa filosa TaxID=46433 RepID=X6NCT3_RETFI|nr:WD-40 repeat protein [Reticulomyxa filosa]|eukprot:ETO24130.1 WD-40 repeat protein [Reticulomyxa filosa]